VEANGVSTGVYIYFASDNGDVYKVRDTNDPGGPAFVWKTSFPGVSIKSGIMDIDGATRLYFGADDKKIHCLEKASGDPCTEWSPLAVGNSTIAGTMVIDNRTGVNAGWAANDDGEVLAIKLGDGTSDKSFSTGGLNMKTSPFLDARVADPNNIIYFTSPNGNLYARVSATMVARWAYPVGVPINTSPFMSFSGPKYIFFGDDSGKLHKVSTEGVSAAGWPFQAGGAIKSSPVWVPGSAVGLATNYVYFGCDDGYIYGINAEDGSRRPGWPVAAGGPVRTDPIVDTDERTLVMGSTDGKIYVLDIGP
jgi:outer membrane protein assembly factor BamB